MASLLTRAALAVACMAPILIAPASAQLQAGPGTWSATQTWATDTSHGGALTGYYYWPSSSHSSTLAQIAPGYYILGNCP